MRSEYEIIQAAETLARYLCWEEPTCKECLLHDMCGIAQETDWKMTICGSLTEEVQEWSNEDWAERKLEAAKRDLEQARWQAAQVEYEEE